MSDTLYLQLDQNIQVTHPHIYLQDIAKLSCSNSKILNRLRVMPVANLAPDKPGRYVMSVMDLITEIQKKEPDLEIRLVKKTLSLHLRISLVPASSGSGVKLFSSVWLLFSVPDFLL